MGEVNATVRTVHTGKPIGAIPAKPTPKQLAKQQKPVKVKRGK